MTADELDREDEDVPELALQGLAAAQRKAEQSGQPLVLVRDGQLVRITATGVTVLKQLGGRRKVDVRTKSARHD